MAWIADDIFAVIVNGGFFYVVRLDDENLDQSKNLSPNRGCKVIFKKKLELQGETRQLLVTKRVIPSYADKVPDGDFKPEQNAI